MTKEAPFTLAPHTINACARTVFAKEGQTDHNSFYRVSYYFRVFTVVIHTVSNLDRRQLLAGPGAATVLDSSPAAVLQHLPQNVVKVARDGRERVIRAAEHLKK